MKATEQYFPVVLFIVLSTRCFLPLSVWMKSLSVTIQMKATERYLLVELFIVLYEVG